MRRRRPALFAAFGLTAAALAAAVVPGAAGAVDQDLVVSAVAGPPGTEVTVSSASCVGSDGIEAFVEVALITGTGPAEQLAGRGVGDQGSATLTVPDWVDPAQPAVLEARCSAYDYDHDVDLSVAFTPVPFDVEPGAGPPVQVRTLSRTELLAGQGFTITGSCGAARAGSIVVAIVTEGTDQSGRDLYAAAAQGHADADADGTFEVPVVMSNATVWIGSDGADSTIDELSIAEEPMDTSVGPYTAFTYCLGSESSPSSLFLEPAALTVTGTAPTGSIDLTVAAGSDEVVLAGECDQAVTGALGGLSLADLVAEFDSSRSAADPVATGSALLTGDRAGRGGLAVRAGEGVAAGPSRLVVSQDAVAFSATPAGDGAWQHQDAAAFDQGVVIGQASCGDPFADGFAYDPQGVVVDVVDVPETTVPPVVPTTVPVPAPAAAAVPGTPTYAG